MALVVYLFTCWSDEDLVPSCDTQWHKLKRRVKNRSLSLIPITRNCCLNRTHLSVYYKHQQGGGKHTWPPTRLRVFSFYILFPIELIWLTNNHQLSLLYTTVCNKIISPESTINRYIHFKKSFLRDSFPAPTQEKKIVFLYLQHNSRLAVRECLIFLIYLVFIFRVFARLKCSKAPSIFLFSSISRVGDK